MKTTRQVCFLITLITGVVLILEHYFRVELVRTVGGELRQWGILIAAIALGVGGINVLQVHIGRIQKRSELWPFSVVLLACLAWITAIGFTQGPDVPGYRVLYEGIVIPVGQALWSLLAVFIATAAYRTFRIRSPEATVLLVAGALVVIGRVPLGEAVWTGFAGIADWIMDVPTTAGMRGVMICTAIGMLAMAIRVLSGVERSFGGAAGGSGD